MALIVEDGAHPTRLPLTSPAPFVRTAPLLTMVRMLRLVTLRILEIWSPLTPLLQVPPTERETGRPEQLLVHVVSLKSRVLLTLIGRTLSIVKEFPASALAPLKIMILAPVRVLRQPSFPIRILTPDVLLTFLKKSSGTETISV